MNNQGEEVTKVMKTMLVGLNEPSTGVSIIDIFPKDIKS